MEELQSSDFTGAINNVLLSLDVSGREMITMLGGVDGLGFKLLGVLFLIMVFYNIILFMLEGSGRIMVDITKLTITWVILASMIAAWTSPAASGVMKNVSVAGFFLNTIPGMSDTFTKDQRATETIVAKHVESMGNAFRVLLKEQRVGQEARESADDSMWDRTWRSAKMATFGWFMALQDGLGVLISSIILLIACGFILWSLLTFVFVLNAGQVMLYIGLALGPILVPFLLVDSLSFLFNGWLRFMISAALYKVIAVLVAILALGAVDQVSLYSKDVATGDESIYFLSLMVLFFAMLGKQLMGMASNIATTLASGGVNSGGTGDSGALVMMMARTRSGIKLQPKEPKPPKPPKSK